MSDVYVIARGSKADGTREYFDNDLDANRVTDGWSSDIRRAALAELRAKLAELAKP